MEEFTVLGFTNRLREVIYDNFPYSKEDRNPSGSLKHPNRPLHIRDVAFKNLSMVIQDNTCIFDIGSDYAEAYYPYYHILEDSQVIRIRNKSTKGSRGSQVNLTQEQLKQKRRGVVEEKYTTVSERAARDFGKPNWNGKTYTQEYKKNVRGVRSKSGKARQYFVGSNGVVYKINQTANYYYNKHFKYIERILDQTLPFIAAEYGLTMKRVQDTGLQEEANIERDSQVGIINSLNILDIMNSFLQEE